MISIILVALSAQQTAILMSCSGTSLLFCNELPTVICYLLPLLQPLMNLSCKTSWKRTDSATTACFTEPVTKLYARNKNFRAHFYKFVAFSSDFCLKENTVFCLTCFLPKQLFEIFLLINVLSISKKLKQRKSVL